MLSLALSAFSLTLSIDNSDIDFGTVNIGDNSFGLPDNNLYITCIADGNPWSVQLQANSDLSSGIYTIPIENLKWFPTGDSPTYGSYISEDPVAVKLYSENIYRSSQAGNNQTLSLQFGVIIPDAQPEGNYQSQLVITITEG